MKKRFTVMVLALLMLFMAGMSGCGGTTEQEGTPTTEATTTRAAQESGGESTGPITWDTADLSWKKDTSPVTFSLFVDLGWYAMQEWGKDDVSREIEKRTGVRLEVSKRTDNNQLSVMLAAGDLPDMVVIEGSQLAARFFKSAVSYPWDELMDKYAPEFRQLIDPVEAMNTTMEDGHFYTLKTHYANTEEWADPRTLPSAGKTGMSVRKDILEELGNPKLESIEDLLGIYDQVGQKYADMSMFVMNLQNRPAFAEWMGIEDWQPKYDKANDKVLHPLNNSKDLWLDYLKLMNGLYTKGYLNPENFTYQNDQYNQVVSSGKVFSVSAAAGGSVDYINDQHYKNGAKGEMAWVKPLTWKGKLLYQPLDRSTGWASLIISRQCKDPERAIRFAEFLKSPEGRKLTQWGIENKHYTLNDKGEPIPTQEYLSIPAEQRLQVTGVGAAWYWQGSLLYESLFSAGVAAGATEGPRQQLNDFLANVKTHTLRMPVLSFANPVPDSDEILIETKLKELMANNLPGIYMARNESDVEAKWDALYNDAQKIGLDKLEQYYNDMYKKHKTKYEK